MRYTQYLEDLLRPLGIYSLEPDTYSGGELCALGRELDEACNLLEHSQREAVVTTAEDYGLTQIEALFARRPRAAGLTARRNAISALLQISGDSFTLEAMNRCLSGCGVDARVKETGERAVVEVWFPGVLGVPEFFEEVRKIIEDILPSHVLIRYRFQYATWGLLESLGLLWSDLNGLSWEALEIYGKEAE